MGRQDVYFPWKCFRVLQFAIFAVSVNSVVRVTQFFTAIGPYFVRDAMGWTPESTGFCSGLITGAYHLGRSLTVRCWAKGVQDLGFRPVFLLGLIVETMTTFVIGIVPSVTVAVLLRLLAGIFSPVLALTGLMIRRLSEEFGEDFPLVAGTLSFVSTLGMIIGYLLSACLAFPAENKIVDGAAFRKFPFLFSWLTNGCIMFLCLCCLCLEMPDLRAERDRPLPRPIHTETKGKQGLGKYAELNEQPNSTDPQRVESTVGPIPTNQENAGPENPVTERKEGNGLEDEDIPGYLQCYELEDIQPDASGRGGLSHRSVLSPPSNLTSRSVQIKPLTERLPLPPVVVRAEDIEPKAEVISTYVPNRSEKTTFVSYMEEDFQRALNTSKVVSLDDPYIRAPGDHPLPYSWGCLTAAFTNLVAGWVEGALVVWVLCRTPDNALSVELMGVVLAWSVAGVWFCMFTLSFIVASVPLHYAFVAHSVLLVLALLLAGLTPFVGLEGIGWILAVLGLFFLLRYCTTFLCIYSTLLLGDSCYIDFRPFTVLRAETWFALSRAIGLALGPVVFSLGEHLLIPQVELSFLCACGLTLAGCIVSCLSAKHFPRFQVSPYYM